MNNNFPSVGPTQRKPSFVGPQQKTVQEAEKTPEQQKTEREKHDRHFNPLNTERIDDGKDLPPLKDWSQYRDYGHKKFRVTHPRLPPLKNSCKMNCRRAYRLVTFDGSVSDAYFALLNNENTIIGVIVLAFINASIRTLDQDNPSTASHHYLSFEFMTNYLGAVFVVYGLVGLARKGYMVIDNHRSETQRVQRAVFDDYENDFKDKMVVFSSRGWRFDSNVEDQDGNVVADAREVAQALWSKGYDEMTSQQRAGCCQYFNQFFLWEDNDTRKKYFSGAPKIA